MKQGIITIIGWAVNLGSGVTSCREDVTVYKAALMGNMSGRKPQNWAILLYFTNQESPFI